MDRFEANVSRPRTALMLLGALVFVALGLAFILDPQDIAGTRRSPTFVRIIGWASVLLFGAFAIGIARQLFRQEPVLEIDAHGILWRRWSDDRIPWRAIRCAEVKSMQRQTFLCLWLVDPEQYRSTHLLGKLAGANRAMGFGDIALNVPATDRRFEDLVAAVDRFAPDLRARS